MTPADQKKDIEKRRAERAERERVARETRDLADLQAIDVLEEKLGVSNLRRYDIDTPLHLPGALVIRRPTPEEYRHWVQVQRRGTKNEGSEATNRLGLDCLVYPEQDAWEKVIEVLPGLPDTIGAYAVRFSGGIEEQKKD